MHEYSRPLGDAVKRARGKLDLTQNEVADIADIDVRTVLNIENYKGNPKMEVLYPLVRALNTGIIAAASSSLQSSINSLSCRSAGVSLCISGLKISLASIFKARTKG